MSVITRFAPSPTGHLHIGAVRTAFFSWLYARKHGGKFRLRIEDTDRLRSTDDLTQLILQSLDWLGLYHDEDVIYQSTRKQVYIEQARSLLEKGSAYQCICSKKRLHELRANQMKAGFKPRYDNTCRDLNLDPPDSTPSVVRFKNPLYGTVEVDDMVQGRVVYDNTELDDLIIVREDGFPTYNFAVVVDEIAMEITHVIRGDDHLNNTPRQINMFTAFGKCVPRFAHVPLILSPEGRKLSKREHAPDVMEFRDAGYLPEAILNYLVRLGWSHGDQEIFTINEMIELFDAKDINRSAASMNPQKLEWLNHQHLMNSDAKRIAQLAAPIFARRGIDVVNCSPMLEDVFEVQKSRSRTLKEFVDRSEYFYREIEKYDEKAAKTHLTSDAGDLLVECKEGLKSISNWDKESIHVVIQAIVQEREIKFGAIAQPIRVALTGNTVSPGIDVTAELIGRERVLRRLDRAIKWIARQSSE